MDELTDGDGVVDLEATQNLLDVPGVEKTVASHHNLKRLWIHRI